MYGCHFVYFVLMSLSYVKLNHQGQREKVRFSS
uniref:Uncharacterized protein n=1 Tax=Anguilla anguilla TaxID=7936 RepID=A0A0E9XGQ6_ANGAN